MMPELARALAQATPRFHAAIQVDPTGCHLWTRSRNSRGYGVFYLDGKLRLAHRVAWLMAHGRWPSEDLKVDHICEVKACVNPDHLRELTNRENVCRSPLSPMNVYRNAVECRNGHPYDTTTRIDSNGWRVCSYCPSRRGRSS
jgi:HNH endonuclease